MKLDISTAVKLTLTDLDRLDPITVYLEEFSPQQGRIVIHCYGKSWAAFWPAMGDCGIAQFFVDCNNAYLVSNLDSSLKSEVNDYEALQKLLLNKVNNKLNSGDLDEDEVQCFNSIKDALIRDAGSLYDDKEGEFWCRENSESLFALLGDEWWDAIPQMPNSDYQYLCRIIDATRDALKQYIATKERG